MDMNRYESFACESEDPTYEIVRFYHPDTGKDRKVMQRGLTLDEAQEHCKDPSTREDGVYFDGYTEE